MNFCIYCGCWFYDNTDKHKHYIIRTKAKHICPDCEYIKQAFLQRIKQENK